MVVVNVMCHEKPMKYTHLKFNSSPPKRKDKRLPTIICSGVFAVRLLGGLSYSVCLMYQGIGRDVPRSQLGPPMGNPYITWVFMGCNLLNPYRTQQIPLGYLYVRGIPVLVP